MADSWTLITPDGPYQLNASFSAPKYQAGGVSGPGALRRDDRNAYQRSGDGLATPGPLTLIGRVWRDDQDQALMLQELEAIRAAVATCTTVTRSNNAGEYVYDDLAGGPTPEVTPDGLGGWVVTIELWPARAAATFIPPGPALVNSWSSLYESTTEVSVPVPFGWEPGDIFVVFTLGSGRLNGDRLYPTSDGWVYVYAPQASSIFGALNVHALTLTESASSSYQFTSHSASRKLVIAVVLRHVQISDFVVAGVREGSSPGVTHTAPSVTPTRVAALLTLFTARDYGGGVFTGQPFTAPAHMQLVENPSNAYLKATVAYQRVNAGATGTRVSSQAPDTARGFSVNLAFISKEGA